MVGGTSNVYVSVTRALDSKHDQTYHRPQHTWMLSVEPHHKHIPGTPRKNPEPVHYTAARNKETGVYAINTHQSDSEPAIIGNILIAESVHTSPDEIHKLLEEVLGPTSPTSSDHTDGGEPEHWIRIAVRAIQERKIAEVFSVDEFMTYARGYEANRMENEAPALVAYPKIHKDHEKKSSKHKFWISHPTASRTKTNEHGEATTYGGLM